MIIFLLSILCKTGGKSTELQIIEQKEGQTFAKTIAKPYLCIVFFMVLDFKVNAKGTS